MRNQLSLNKLNFVNYLKPDNTFSLNNWASERDRDSWGHWIVGSSKSKIESLKVKRWSKFFISLGWLSSQHRHSGLSLDCIFYHQLVYQSQVGIAERKIQRSIIFNSALEEQTSIRSLEPTNKTIKSRKFQTKQNSTKFCNSSWKTQSQFHNDFQLYKQSICSHY